MSHPYEDLESHPQWDILKEGIHALEENNDLTLTTNSNYVIGYLLKKLTEENVTIRLSKNEALVLFELVSRFSEKDELKIEDESEERVLWSVCATLEKALIEPLKPDYLDLLESARNKLKET